MVMLQLRTEWFACLQPQEHTMRKFTSVVLPIIAAVSLSGLMLSATIA